MSRLSTIRDLSVLAPYHTKGDGATTRFTCVH